LKIVTARPAAATAPSAASVARGRQRLRQSPAAAIAAKSGHFTHHAEASSRTNVAGLQRMLSPKAEAAWSQARTMSTSPSKAQRIAAAANSPSMRTARTRRPGVSLKTPT
jgi:hypothetical protein